MVLVRNVSGEDRIVAGQDPEFWPAEGDDASREVTGDAAKSLLAQEEIFKRTDKGRGTRASTADQSASTEE